MWTSCEAKTNKLSIYLDFDVSNTVEITLLSSRQKVSRQWAHVSVTMGDKPAKLVLAGDPWQVNPGLASSDVRKSFFDPWCFLPSAVENLFSHYYACIKHLYMLDASKKGNTVSKLNFYFQINIDAY